MRFNKTDCQILAIVVLLMPCIVNALPSLQLGPDTTNPDWVYDTTTQTWSLFGMGSLAAYANSNTTDANGSYAWDAAGAGAQLAYLIVSAVPKASDDTDIFEITVMNGSNNLTLFDSGFGAPPMDDPNSTPGHGIFDTYFEVYQFSFDGSITSINNTQPGDTGTGDGFVELFDITMNSTSLGLGDALHFDLFTVSGDGIYTPNSGVIDKDLVNAFAPFSHDAEMTVPEPATLALMGLGLAGFWFTRKRKRQKF